MAKRIKPAKQSALPLIKAGDLVLVGGGRASYPWEWFTARVAWADDQDVLLSRSDQNGCTHWRQHESIHAVRAVGDIAQLLEVKRRASEGVHELQKQVDDCTHALGAAREALWKHLEAMADAGLAVIPLNEEALDAHTATARAGQEAHEASTFEHNDPLLQDA